MALTLYDRDVFVRQSAESESEEAAGPGNNCLTEKNMETAQIGISIGGLDMELGEQQETESQEELEAYAITEKPDVRVRVESQNTKINQDETSAGASAVCCPCMSSGKTRSGGKK